MFLLSVKFKDGRSILCDKVTYIDLSELPSVSYEVDHVPYIKTFDIVHFREDRESGGCDLSEFWRELPDR